MNTKKTCGNNCPFMMSRRRFLGSTAAFLAASQMEMFDFASKLLASEYKATGKSMIRVAFVRPKVKSYWMGWPGACYDIKARQKQYTQILKDTAEKLGVKLEFESEPIDKDEDSSKFVASLANSKPDGIMLVMMCLHHTGSNPWKQADLIAKDKGEIPMVVFSPMGTSFTQHINGTSFPNLRKDGVFVGSTQDLGWLSFGLRMLDTVWQMKNTRLLIIRGERREQKLDVIGTTLQFIKEQCWVDEFNKTAVSPEIKEIANYYTKNAKKIVEPNAEDILNAATTYVVAKKLMAQENCQGISLNCLPLVQQRKISCPPCIAWLRLNDEGSVGCCETDTGAAIALRLTSLLCGQPGFMQDPVPNTVNNTFMGAHCSCPTKLDGFDKPPAEFILRSHSESETGVAPQVLWRIGQKVTVMDFDGPGKIILGTGKVLRNIDTPPAGGCRTSVELEMDNIPDTRDIAGFHQPFIYGDWKDEFKAYCTLAGIKFENIYRPQV